MMPEMTTINDFFFKAGEMSAAGRIPLLLRLYDCYKRLNPRAEPLDDFIFWGDVILADFNDVDKYLVDPKQIFTNVSDLRAVHDDYSYLTENQRKAIGSFVSHFADANFAAAENGDAPGVKERFLRIWNLLHPLYVSFNGALSESGTAYEGMVYRSVAERLGKESAADLLGRTFPHCSKVVFVGLNALNECEKTLLRKLRDASLAEFCWDYSGKMIRDPRNRSSFFMEENVREFGQAAEWDEEGTGVPEINVVSVPSSVGQVKLLPHLFGGGHGGGAVVLPDETLLQPLLNSIPESIRDVNVTMGCPMSSSLFHSLMSDLSSMLLHTAARGDSWVFYHRQVRSVFSNGIFRKIADAETLEKVSAVQQAAKYYIPLQDISGTALLDLLFRPVVSDAKAASGDQIRAIAAYQKETAAGIAAMMRDVPGMSAELEFAAEYYKSVCQLEKAGLEVLPSTYMRLLSRLLSGVSVPFRGEPLKGFQIMGPLETRALDFRTLVIMSANEGVFPKRNVSSSFIPPELRRGFSLPTYEYQDAVWAYYFYRMITRAEKVWMLYDSRTDGLKSGEESRYIKQLQYHFRLPVRRWVAAGGSLKPSDGDVIAKTPEDMERIASACLSATAVQNYIACPARFYYRTVKGLLPEKEVAESLDRGMLGTVYHDTMWALYCGEEAMSSREPMDKTAGKKFFPMKWISADYISGWLKREKDIKEKIKSLICMQLNTDEVTGRDIVVSDVIMKYVTAALRRDLEQIRMSGRDGFELLGLELKVYGTIAGHRFVGYIDRLDSFSEGSLRVVDYKSGKVDDYDTLEIDDDGARKIADEIFGAIRNDETGKISVRAALKNKRPKIPLQFCIYDILLDRNGMTDGKQLYNSVYSVSGLFSGVPVSAGRNMAFCRAVEERLGLLLEEISNPGIPFARTDDREKECAYCDFKMICGR